MVCIVCKKYMLILIQEGPAVAGIIRTSPAMTLIIWKKYTLTLVIRKKYTLTHCVWKVFALIRKKNNCVLSIQMLETH